MAQSTILINPAETLINLGRVPQ